MGYPVGATGHAAVLLRQGAAAGKALTPTHPGLAQNGEALNIRRRSVCWCLLVRGWSVKWMQHIECGQHLILYHFSFTIMVLADIRKRMLTTLAVPIIP